MYNYPVKYTLMPIEEYVGSNLPNDDNLGICNSRVQYGEKHKEIIGYVVSKCYVIERKIRYLEDGNQNEWFSVVFPYQQKDNYGNSYSKKNPISLLDTICLKQSLLHDTYEEASIQAKDLNQKILQSSLERVPIIDKMNLPETYQYRLNLIKKMFQNRLNFFQLLATNIEENTKEMKINLDKKEKKLSKIKGKKRDE